jgi:hypothetical protein
VTTLCALRVDPLEPSSGETGLCVCLSPGVQEAEEERARSAASSRKATREDLSAGMSDQQPPSAAAIAAAAARSGLIKAGRPGALEC